MVVVCGPRVVTCIWHRVTMLTLCILGKSSHHPSPHSTSLSAEPSFFPHFIRLDIDPSSPFTLTRAQIRYFSGLPPHTWKNIASSSAVIAFSKSTDVSTHDKPSPDYDENLLNPSLLIRPRFLAYDPLPDKFPTSTSAEVCWR